MGISVWLTGFGLVFLFVCFIGWFGVFFEGVGEVLCSVAA